MGEFLSGFVSDMVGRVDGPLNFRLLIQPCVAIALALRDGRQDAKDGRPPYGWALLSDPAHRRYLVREGWKSVAKVFVLAYVLDIAYQFMVFGGVRPLQGLVIAIALAIIPYLLLRGIAGRLMGGRATNGTNQ